MFPFKKPANKPRKVSTGSSSGYESGKPNTSGSSDSSSALSQVPESPAREMPPPAAPPASVKPKTKKEPKTEPRAPENADPIYVCSSDEEIEEEGPLVADQSLMEEAEGELDFSSLLAEGPLEGFGENAELDGEYEVALANLEKMKPRLCLDGSAHTLVKRVKKSVDPVEETEFYDHSDSDHDDFDAVMGTDNGGPFDQARAKQHQSLKDAFNHVSEMVHDWDDSRSAHYGFVRELINLRNVVTTTAGSGVVWDPREVIDFAHTKSLEEIKEPIKGRLEGMIIGVQMMLGEFNMSDRRANLMDAVFNETQPVLGFGKPRSAMDLKLVPYMECADSTDTGGQSDLMGIDDHYADPPRVSAGTLRGQCSRHSKTGHDQPVCQAKPRSLKIRHDPNPADAKMEKKIQEWEGAIAQIYEEDAKKKKSC